MTSRMRADIIDLNIVFRNTITIRRLWSRISNEELCKLWLETTLRGMRACVGVLSRVFEPTVSDRPTAFVTEGGWSGEALGTVQVGDLAYQLNNQEAFFLRHEGQRLLLAGVSRCAFLLCPDSPIPLDELFINISVLRGFCEFFAGVVTFRTLGRGFAGSNDGLYGDINGLAIPRSYSFVLTRTVQIATSITTSSSALYF
jgi:hypothetical protein